MAFRQGRPIEQPPAEIAPYVRSANPSGAQCVHSKLGGQDEGGDMAAFGREIRKRKGLKEGVPALDTYLDKL